MSGSTALPPPPFQSKPPPLIAESGLPPSLPPSFPPPSGETNGVGGAPSMSLPPPLPVLVAGHNLPPPPTNAHQAAQEKINRELFVGHTPPDMTEMLLMQFLNSMARRLDLCEAIDTPILNCRVNQKFAFIECTTPEIANRILNLDGIPFLGAFLKVSRPYKYTGPPVLAKSWYELTGQVAVLGDIVREAFSSKSHQVRTLRDRIAETE